MFMKRKDMYAYICTKVFVMIVFIFLLYIHIQILVSIKKLIKLSIKVVVNQIYFHIFITLNPNLI